MSFSESVNKRFMNSNPQVRLRILIERAADANPFNPSIVDIRDSLSALVIRSFSPLVRAICAGEELTARLCEKVRTRVSGI